MSRRHSVTVSLRTELRRKLFQRKISALRPFATVRAEDSVCRNQLIIGNDRVLLDHFAVEKKSKERQKNRKYTILLSCGHDHTEAAAWNTLLCSKGRLAAPCVCLRPPACLSSWNEKTPISNEATHLLLGRKCLLLSVAAKAAAEAATNRGDGKREKKMPICFP